MLILGSHPFSWWLYFFFRIGSGGSSGLEGNPVNRVFYSALIVASIVIVARRGVSWRKVIRENRGLALFFGYLALTVLWADFPIATTKRWIKEVGAIPVLLVILTEERPIEAVKVVFTRCGFILFAYSILVIKYIPEIGRIYSHDGGLQVIGITEQKNSLGEIVVACSLILLWQLIEHWPKERRRLFKPPLLQWSLTFAMGLWLLVQCDSKTWIVSLLLGSAILLSTRIQALAVRPKMVIRTCLVAVPLFYTADQLFRVSEPLLRMMGRNPSLTNRTDIWAAVRAHGVNPVIGCGFLNYWDALGPVEVKGYEVELKTAHNGYLETYLDGGIIGVCVLGVMLLQAGFAQSRAFLQRSPASALGFAVFCVILVANVSESLYARRTPLWVCFLLFCLFTPRAVRAARPELDASASVDKEGLYRLPA
jgi:O-antigen ligase